MCIPGLSAPYAALVKGLLTWQRIAKQPHRGGANMRAYLGESGAGRGGVALNTSDTSE